MAVVRKHYQDAKAALRRATLPDAFFVSRYGFSPYRACQHGCVYCDGRAEKYFVDGDFDRDIVIRKNLPGLLRRDLERMGEPGTVAISSGVSDPYQPVEEEERLTRGCAEVLADFSFAVLVMTKSALILRDIDLWQQVHERCGVTLLVSLTFLDDGARAIFEPGASSVEERVEVLRAFKARGMYTAICAMPFMPNLTDSYAHVKSLLGVAAAVGVDYVMAGGLTLRPGIQKETFMRTLRSHFPEHVEEYERLFGENRPSGAPVAAYSQRLGATLRQAFGEQTMPQRMPHYVYRGMFSHYDEVYVLLRHMHDLYRERGVDVRPLKTATSRYEGWLSEERRRFFRRRGVSYETIDGKLGYLIETGELAAILGNERLARFVGKVVVEGKLLDYHTLRLHSREG